MRSMRVLGTTWNDIGRLLLAAIVFVGGFFLVGVVHNFVQERIKNEWLSIPIALCVVAATAHRLLAWAVDQAKDHSRDRSQ